MAVAFTRTVRALRPENAFVYWILLAVAMILLVFWGHWFFTARLANTVEATAVRLHPETLIIQREFADGMTVRTYPFRQHQLYASFDKESFSKVRLGQMAWIRIRSPQGQAVHTVGAEVIEIEADRYGDGGEVRLRSEVDAKQADYLADYQSLRVLVEIEPTTPAQLVMSTAGIGVDTPAVSVRRE